MQEKSSKGSLKISESVIASIVEYTLLESEGVAGLAPVTAESTGWIVEKQTIKPISVSLNDGVAVIDVRISVKSDVKVHLIAEKLQKAIKEAVQNMTGVVVSTVNLHIDNVLFEK